MAVNSTWAWVTSAVTGEQARNAAMLANSLRNLRTSHCVIVVAPQKLNRKFRDCLAASFDLVLYFYDEDKPEFLSLEEFAKISAIAETNGFDRCVYISPGMVLKRNADAIFEHWFWNSGSAENADLLFSEKDSEDCNIILYRPSIGTYWKLMGMASAWKGSFRNLITATLGECCASTVYFGEYCDTSNFHDKKLTQLDLLPETTLSAPPLGKEAVAIVGMACRFPQCSTIEEFWDLLINGKSGISTPPPFRWVNAAHSGSNEFRGTKAGFLGTSVDEFDSDFFQFSPREATSLDPQLRLLLEVVWDALADAAISPKSLRSTSGSVFLGTWNNDYKPLLRESRGNWDDFGDYICNGLGSMAARISSWLGMTGPCVTTESGCSSAMVALHLACRSLLNGETNLALAAGANLLLRPYDHNLIPMALSSEGSCKTFCERADGYARADGCGVLVLKRLSDAIKDGDSIWALIRGSGCSQDGLSNSLGTPTIAGESLAMTRALEDAQVDLKDVSYVEAHGSGTPVGDPIEMAAIAGAYRSKERKELLAIGSVKTNIGHTESCSGIAGVMKVVLAMHHGVIPPHKNLETLNPSINLDSIPGRIPLESLEWKRSQGNRRLAGVSSFGITATNAHLILEEPPTEIAATEKENETLSDRTCHILKMSAKTPQALQIHLSSLETNLSHHGTATLPDVAYTGNVGRADYNCRAVIVANSKEEVAQNIREGKLLMGELPPNIGLQKICFVFGGHDTHYPTMPRKLYETSPVFRTHFDHCADILKSRYGIFLDEIAFGTASALENFQRHAATFSVQYGLLRLWESWGICADYSLGYQLEGELAAAVCAGIMSVDEAILVLMEKDVTPIKNFSGITGHCEFISPFRGRLLKLDHVDKNYWRECIENGDRPYSDCSNVTAIAMEIGCQIFIEMGGDTLRGNINGDVTAIPSLSSWEDDWTVLLRGLGRLYIEGVTIDWLGFDKCYRRKKVRQLPRYPFQRKKYWPIVCADITPNRTFEDYSLLGNETVASTSTRVFQSKLNLESHRYLGDHLIGTTVMFPGAGYLGIFLAIGEARHTKDGKFPFQVAVNDILFKAPMALFQSEAVEIQTVAELDNSRFSAENVKILQRMESEWLLHASATVTLTNDSHGKTQLPVADVQQLLMEVKRSGREIDVNLNFYSELESAGLPYGPHFRSLENVWLSVHSGENILVADVKTANLFRGDAHHRRDMIHPVVLDAMLQGIVLLKMQREERSVSGIMIPSKIGKLLWLAQPTTENAHLFVQKVNGDDKVVLFDGNGVEMAAISGVEFTRRTASWMEAAVKKQKVTQQHLPDLWEEVWEPEVGPMQHRVDLEKCSRYICNGEVELFNDELFFKAVNRKYKVRGEEDTAIMRSMNKLIYYNILRGLYDCGMETLLPGQVFSEEELFTRLKIVPKYRRLLTLYLDILQNDGILEREIENPDRMKVVGVAPTLENLEDLCAAERTPMLAERFRSAMLLSKMGERLSEILVGKESPLPILFPKESQEEISADLLYKEFYRLNGFSELYGEVVTRWLLQFKDTAKEKAMIRILEVGAGSGSLTKVLLSALESAGVSFQYTFTDISSSFFSRAEKLFEKWGDSMIYRKLNVEEDPIAQQFVPEYFDYICGLDVIHATKNIRETLSNLRILLRPFGRLEIAEMTERLRLSVFPFGTIDGFWRFEDFDLRQGHCTLSTSGWRRALTSAGFHVVGVASTLKNTNSSHSVICCEKLDKFVGIPTTVPPKNLAKWIVFHQEDSPLSHFLLGRLAALKTRKVVAIRPSSKFEICDGTVSIRRGNEGDISSLFELLWQMDTKLEGIIYCWTLDKTKTNQKDILETLLYLGKALANSTNHMRGITRLIALFSGVAPVTETTVSLPGVFSSTAWGFLKSFQAENPDILCRCLDSGEWGIEDARKMEVYYEILNPEKLGNQVAYDKGTRHVPKLLPHKNQLKNAGLLVETPRFQLHLPESNLIDDLYFTRLEYLATGEEEVEVHVTAYGLNFHDILTVLKPSEDFRSATVIGMEYSGVVTRAGRNVKRWSVGDRVFGLNFKDTLSSHLTIHQDDVFRLADEISFCDAATLPVAFATAYFCLVELAQIKNDDIVLIHAASGGVGLCAVQLCQRIGATIICTVGSKRKRNYLRSLGVQHIFNSRDTDYAKNVLEITRGRGVNVVLNSLTGEGFKEATLLCCAGRARFIEMSKLSIWTAQEISALRPDVIYKIVDVEALDTGKLRMLMQTLVGYLRERKITPLPYTRFEGVYVRQALFHLQKAKHIGKVICTIPEKNDCVWATPMFHSQGTYLITGGLGGIGFQVCQWLLEEGAKYIVLTGRSAASASAVQLIAQLNLEYDAAVKYIRVDIGDYRQMEKIICSDIPEMDYPPLRGVMHSAGILSNGLIKNQNWADFSSTLRAKVNGTVNLHELTKYLRLEHFVLFSSLTSHFGLPGQSNHTAGNSFQDAFAHYRHSIGLPVTVVNWGQWGDVGIAKDTPVPGLKSLTTSQGIACLKYALQCNIKQVGVWSVESYEVLMRRFPHFIDYFNEKIVQGMVPAVSAGSMGLTTSDQFWKMFATKNDSSEKLDLLKRELSLIVRMVLKLDKTDVILDTQELVEMGVDSLMNIEVKNAIQALLGTQIQLNSNLIGENSCIQALAGQVLLTIESLC